MRIVARVLLPDPLSDFVKPRVIIRPRVDLGLCICELVSRFNLINYFSVHRRLHPGSLHLVICEALLEARVQADSGFAAAGHHRSPLP